MDLDVRVTCDNPRSGRFDVWVTTSWGYSGPGDCDFTAEEFDCDIEPMEYDGGNYIMVSLSGTSSVDHTEATGSFGVGLATGTCFTYGTYSADLSR